MAEAQIDKLSLEIDYQAGQSATGIDNLVSSIEKLKNATSNTVSILTRVSNGIGKFKDRARELSEVDTDTFSTKFNKLITSINGINQIQEASGLKKTLNQLKQIPKVLEKLDEKTVDTFTDRIEKLTQALTPLANNLEKVQGNISNLPSKLNKVKNYTDKSTQSFNGLQKISNLLNFGVLVGIFTRLGSKLGEFTEKSAGYVEDLNLFNVSMGESTRQAKEFIDTISGTLGLDPSQMMRNMGTFNVMAEGFGIASDKAYIMSKNLTQLTYDFSSFFNLDFETSATKLRSALAGEVEPMRALGISLTQATLQQVAFENGITKSVATMSEAEKAQLRYIALMTRITEAQGDMGRTLDIYFFNKNIA